MPQSGWTSKHFAKSKKPDAKDYILYDCIYTKYSEKANIQGQKADKWLPSTGGGNGGLTANAQEGFHWHVRMF